MIRGVRWAVGAQVLGVLMVTAALTLWVPLLGLLFAGVALLVAGVLAEADDMRSRSGG